MSEDSGRAREEARAELACVPLGLQQRDERGELAQLERVARAVLVEIKEDDEAVLRHPFQKIRGETDVLGRAVLPGQPLRRLYVYNADAVPPARRGSASSRTAAPWASRRRSPRNLAWRLVGRWAWARRVRATARSVAWRARARAPRAGERPFHRSLRERDLEVCEVDLLLLLIATLSDAPQTHYRTTWARSRRRRSRPSGSSP